MKFLFGMLNILTVLLTWRESCILGELTLIQGAPFPISNYPRIMAKRLTCISEDDLSALVWNEDLKNYNGSYAPIKFVDSSTKQSTVDCRFDSSDGCVERWDQTSNWNTGYIWNDFMGPVMDRRWEDFSTLITEMNSSHPLLTGNGEMGTTIFSMRGTTDLQILYCESLYKVERCFWIAFGGQIGAAQFTAGYGDNKYYYVPEIPYTECEKIQVSRKHPGSFLSDLEWKTLTMQLNMRNDTLAVYNEVERIISCRFSAWGIHDSLSVRATRIMYKNHHYKFICASKADEPLMSPWADVLVSNICIEMVIGLCAGCEVSVKMINERGDSIMMGDVRSKSSLNGDGQVPWQQVKFNRTFDDSFGKRVRFRVVTHILRDDPRPLWAIGYFRMCKHGDAVRSSSMNSTQVWDEEKHEYTWPVVRCQKLSYSGGSMVRSSQVIQHGLKHDMPSCDYGKVGPHCAIDCSSISEDANCRKVSICLAGGCTCAKGWRGENCDVAEYTREAEKPNLLWLMGIPIIVGLVLLTYYAYNYRKRRVILEVMDVGYIQQSSHATGNPDDPYVVPRETRRPLPNRPNSSNCSAHAIYLDIGSNTNIISGIYESISIVRVEKFEDYVKESVFSGLLEKEYGTLPLGQKKPWECGKLPQNMAKNRFEDLIAYDETRVVLKKLRGHPHSDYINASYIKGYKRGKAYIATQWPLPETVNDFWRMVWKKEVHNICLLSEVIRSETTECNQYWPEVGSREEYGEVVVINSGQKIFADYTSRTFRVTYKEKTRKIEHLHYTAWPDHEVPMFSHSVVSFLKKVLALSLEDGPLVVQSTAGVGRTGIVILCDISLRRAGAEGVIDVFEDALQLCSQRINMINNKQQYLLAHFAIAECLLAPQTALPCNEDLPTRIHRMREQIIIQQQRLRDCVWKDDILRPIASQQPLLMRDLEKNRYPNIAPAGNSRVHLSRYPDSDESSEYISAVHVDGIKLNNQYLATQLPMPSTLGDFWRMIAEQEAEMIIVLQLPDPEDSTCCEIVPDAEFEPVPFLEITVITELDGGFYSMLKVHLRDSSEVIDVFENALQLRNQRINMINNKQQYLLAHFAIAECLLAPQTMLPCNENLPTGIHRMKEQIIIQQQRLRDCAWKDEFLRPSASQQPLSWKDLEKNRYLHIAPAGNSRVHLSRYPDSDESSQYISAVHVDGIKLNNQYLATQLPMPSTLGDFWRMIAEQEAEMIIVLQLPDPEDSTCCEIIPDAEFELVPFLDITVVTELDGEFYSMLKVQLRDSSEVPPRTRAVTIFKCKEWERGFHGKPPSPDILVALWVASEKISRDGPTVAVCHDGLTGCGLYLALSFLLERMSVEHECDVYVAIRAVRRSRPEFVESLEQMNFLYEAAEKYAECFKTYANFK